MRIESGSREGGECLVACQADTPTSLPDTPTSLLAFLHMLALSLSPSLSQPNLTHLAISGPAALHGVVH